MNKEQELLDYLIENHTGKADAIHSKDLEAKFNIASCTVRRYQSTYVIPQGIREIAQDAFYRAAAIGEIVLPDSLEKIGKEAFLYCSMLTRVSGGSGLSEIGNSAFYGCENLNQVTLPVTLTKIGEQAFSRCPNLILAVYRDSYALEYCRENALKYSYTDSQDWLKD